MNPDVFIFIALEAAAVLGAIVFVVTVLALGDRGPWVDGRG